MASCHEVLCAIAKADLASADRKAAVRRAVEVAFLGAVALDRGGTDAGEEKQDVHDYYEHVLTGISRLAGRTKTMKVEEAKTWIRGHEDAEALKLATRLGKLSQRRNGRIHQDWLLLEAVAEMVTRAPEAPNTGGQTTGAGELAREGTAGQTRQLRRAGSEPEKEPTMHAQGGDAIFEPRQLKVQLSDASTATSVDPADEPAVGNRLHRSTGVQATVAKRRTRGVQTAGKGSAPEDECSQVRAARGAGAPEDECSQVRAARGAGAPDAVLELPPTGMSCGKAMVRCPTLPPSEIFFYGDTLVETGCQTDSADVAGGVKQDDDEHGAKQQWLQQEGSDEHSTREGAAQFDCTEDLAPNEEEDDELSTADIKAAWPRLDADVKTMLHFFLRSPNGPTDEMKQEIKRQIQAAAESSNA